jgi:hypothetical protein
LTCNTGQRLGASHVAPAALTAHEQAIGHARLALGEAAFAAAWAEGRAQTRDQAIAEALSLTRTVATACTARRSDST